MLFKLAKPHRSEGAITAGLGGHLGTETLHSRVSWICSAILWSFSPRCPLFILQSATGVPINLSILLSSPEDRHPTQFGTVHPTWQPTLEGLSATTAQDGEHLTWCMLAMLIWEAMPGTCPLHSNLLPALLAERQTYQMYLKEISTAV